MKVLLVCVLCQACSSMWWGKGKWGPYQRPRQWTPSLGPQQVAPRPAAWGQHQAQTEPEPDASVSGLSQPPPQPALDWWGQQPVPQPPGPGLHGLVNLEPPGPAPDGLVDMAAFAPQPNWSTHRSFLRRAMETPGFTFQRALHEWEKLRKDRSVARYWDEEGILWLALPSSICFEGYSPLRALTPSSAGSSSSSTLPAGVVVGQNGINIREGEPAGPRPKTGPVVKLQVIESKTHVVVTSISGRGGAGGSTQIVVACSLSRPYRPNMASCYVGFGEGRGGSRPTRNRTYLLTLGSLDSITRRHSTLIAQWKPVH